MANFLFLIRSLKPYHPQRRDINSIMDALIEKGHNIHIYDPKQGILMDLNNRTTTTFAVGIGPFIPKKLYAIKNFLVLRKFLKQKKNVYDIVQPSYIREEYLLLPRTLSKVGKKTVLLLFGTDINQRTFIKNNFRKLYKLSDSVIVTNSQFGETARKHARGALNAEKMTTLMLPQPQFSHYYDFSFESKGEAKKTLGFPLNKTVVVVGSNLNSNEQHELIIEELKKMVTEDFYFVFALSSPLGKMSQREVSLRKLIEDSFTEVDYHIISGWIDDDKMAIVRHASDILVNMRIMDQLAASMLESNLAYTHVIAGSWLPYDTYAKCVKLDRVDSIEELPAKIKEIQLEDPAKNREKLVFNKQSVLQNYDNKVMADWINHYEQYINKH